MNILKKFDPALSIILSFYFFSFWFFSYWVQKNHGVIWDSPLNIAHHPFGLYLFDTNFFQTLTYMFMQTPFYSLVTWLMLKTDPSAGFRGYLILHYVLGTWALIALYKTFNYLKVNKVITTLALSYFVFNPGFYYEFTSGWYDFISMCLVAILVWRFICIIDKFNNRNLIYFFLTLMLLASYRNAFHPILFFIPTLVILIGSYRDKWKNIIACAMLPFLIVLAPYVKNEMVFHVFDVGIGSYALAIKSVYQYEKPEEVVNEVKAGNLSKLSLCYLIDNSPVYQGVTYDPNYCFNKFVPQYAEKEVQHILQKQPYLAGPQVLVYKNGYVGFTESTLPNTLAGLVVAKQLKQDAFSFITHHPGKYALRTIHDFLSLFRTNNTYVYLVANNTRHFPLWFANGIFSLDPFGIVLPSARYPDIDQAYRPELVFGISCSIIYALLFAANVRRRNGLAAIFATGILVILSPLILNNRFYKEVLGMAVIWDILFVLPLVLLTIKQVFMKKTIDSFAEKSRLIVTYMSFVCLYIIVIFDLIPATEQERYRFIVEGFLIYQFIFFISNMFCYVKFPKPVALVQKS